MKKQDFVLINLSNYVRPDLVENKSRNWVLNGNNMEFYQYIIDRNNGSPTNGSINKSYADLIYGRGIAAYNASTSPSDWAKFKSILKDKELRKVVKDFQIFDELSMQVVKEKGSKKGLAELAHIPKNLVAPSIENEDGEIESYWYSRDWTKIYKAENIPEEFPAFGSGADLEYYVSTPYSPGQESYGQPDYFPGLQYCRIEEEISNQNLSSILNGLSMGYIINIPDGNSLSDEEKKAFEKKIKDKLIGSSNASNFVLSFNGRDVEVTITPFPVNDNIHKQWETLNESSVQKILTSHRCTSPSIVGVVSSSGFSNTADEMEQARLDLLKYVIKTKQDFIIESLQEILVSFGINLDLYFKPLTEIKEEPVELSKHVCLSDDGASEGMADSLIELGSDGLEGYDLLCSADVDYDTDDDLFGLVQFAKTGTARPNSKSEQDSDDIAIRYRYVGGFHLTSRIFCQKMSLANKLYRKEDIIQMEKPSTNPGFGQGTGGKNGYSIWLWKGGGKMSTAFPNGTCKHKWHREIYLKRGGGVDANSPLAKTISTSEARRRGYKVPVNDSDVSITPHNNK